MKIDSISYNKNYRSLSVNYSTGTAFCARVNAKRISEPFIKVSELRDMSNTDIRENISKMLDFARFNKYKRLITGRSFFDRMKSMVVTGLTQNQLDKYLEIYVSQGRKDFWNANYNTFEKIINTPEAMNCSGYVDFRAERDILRKQENIDEKEIALHISPEIQSKLYSFGYHNGALGIIKEHFDFLKEFAEKVRLSQSKTAETIHMTGYKNTNKIQEQKFISEANGLLNELRSTVKARGKFPSDGTAEEQAAWHALDDKARALRCEIRDKDISIMEKKEFSLDPLAETEAKKRYLLSITSDGRFNRATQSDVIGEFEKYITRDWEDEKKAHSLIDRFTTACCPIEGQKNITNEYKYSVADRYIDVMQRIAERDPSGMRDSVQVLLIMKEYNGVMDEKLSLKYIDLLKRISFQQVDVMEVEFNTRKVNSSKVRAAIEELKDSLKEYPVEDRTLND